MSNQFFDLKSSIKEFLKLDEEIRSLSKAKCERLRKKEKINKEINNQKFGLSNTATVSKQITTNQNLINAALKTSPIAHI